MGSAEVYQKLRTEPVRTLETYEVVVQNLPACRDATVVELYFSSSESDMGNAIGISDSADSAQNAAQGTGSPAVRKKMAVSSMRGTELSLDAGPTGRYKATVVLDSMAADAELWVTQLQTGCSVLILDWGGGRYSMIHLQPSEDHQFNIVGRGIMSLGSSAKYVYKNLWMKKELTKIVTVSEEATPQKYILVQSLFEGSRSAGTQVIGLLKDARFGFYKQRQVTARGIQTLTVTTLKWNTWSVLLPYMSY